MEPHEINRGGHVDGCGVGAEFSGAGDEIRTHDPNLGKVVLYP